MNKNNRLLLIKKNMRQIYSFFPLTIILIVLSTLFFTIVLESNFFNTEILKNIFIFLSLLITGTFFAETYRQNSNMTRRSLYIIFLFISFILVLLKNKTTSSTLELVNRLITTYLLIFNISSFYELFIISKKSEEEYLLKVFTNLLWATVIFIITSLGGISIASIFNYLLLNSSHYDIIWRFELLIFGIMFVPSILYSLINTNIEVSKVIKIIVKYVLGTLLILSSIIIYLYMFKIIIFKGISSNQIFRILTSLFVIGVPICTMNNFFKSKQQITRYFPHIFIPLIFLQIYTLFIRIYQNGFSPLRYIGIMFIVAEIIYIFLYIKNNKRVSIIIPICNALIIISILLPLINMYDVSNRSQLNIIQQYFENNKKIPKEKLYGAYEYLNSTSKGKKYLNKISKEARKTLNQQYKSRYIYSTEEFISSNINLNDINIEGYSVCHLFQKYEDIDYQSVEEVFDKFIVYDQQINMTNIINSYIEGNKVSDFNDYFKNYHEFELDENNKIVLSHITLSLNQDDNTIIYYEIEGYLLTR